MTIRDTGETAAQWVDPVKALSLSQVTSLKRTSYWSCEMREGRFKIRYNWLIT